jgi:type IV pilus assembly protein PilV
MPLTMPRTLRKTHGFTLIEVLVVMALFSFGLLGLVGLQAKAVQYSVGAEDSSRAALLANEIVSTMWGARSVTLPTATITAWQTRVADPRVNGLPNGAGAIAVTSNVATVTITWRGPSEPSSASHQYVTQVLIP